MPAGLKKFAKPVSRAALYKPELLPRVSQTSEVSRSWFAGKVGSANAALLKLMVWPFQRTAAPAGTAAANKTAKEHDAPMELASKWEIERRCFTIILVKTNNKPKCS